MGGRRRRRRDLSSGFWRGCGAIAVLSVAGFLMLTGGTYKNGVEAPTVHPGAALLATMLASGVALLVLVRWERRRAGDDR